MNFLREPLYRRSCCFRLGRELRVRQEMALRQGAGGV